MRNIVAFVGFKGCGKNSAANILTRYGYTNFAYADSLKDTVATIFCWDRKMVEGDTAESRVWRETVDTWWAKKLDMPHFTPRFALQYVGTDLFRKHFHTNVWLMNMERRIDLVGTDIAITDCRFPNEIGLVRELGGTIIRIKRGDEPIWYNDALLANTEQNFSIMEKHGIHESEWAWIGQHYHHVIENSSSIDRLEQAVLSVVK
jgi:hypothetical protein